MASLTYIRTRINFYNDLLHKTRKNKDLKEDEFNSLMTMKKSVLQRQSAFSRANKDKIRALEIVRGYINDNSFAKKYYNRTQNGVMGVGNKIIGRGFSSISKNLDRESRKIQNEINTCIRDINTYNRKIRDLERQYEEEKRRQAQMTSAGGGGGGGRF